MNLDSAFPGKYVKAEEFPPNFSHVLTIQAIVMEKFEDQRSGQTVQKPVVYFRNAERGLVLNVTNKNMMKDVFGTAESDEMIGRDIELYRTEVEAFGKRQAALRLRAPGGGVNLDQGTKAEQPTNSPPAAVAADDDDDIPF